MKEMIDEHVSHPSIIMWVTFNEGWGQYDIKRVAEQAKAWDPTRLVNNQSGLNLGADGGAGDIMDEHGYPSPALPPSPDGERALVTGEYGGLGLAVPGHAWSVQQSYVDVDPQTYTDDYLTKLDEVRALVCRGQQRCGLHPDLGRRGRAERPDDLRPHGPQAGRRAGEGRPRGPDPRRVPAHPPRDARPPERRPERTGRGPARSVHGRPAPVRVGNFRAAAPPLLP